MRLQNLFARLALFLGLLAAVFIAGDRSALTLEYLGTAASPSEQAEIVAYDPATHRVYATAGTGIDAYRFGDDNELTPLHTIDLADLFGRDAQGNSRLASVSSLAIDPLGRGFAAAVAIPTQNALSVGSLVLFDLVTAEVLCQLPVGYNPDMVAFSPDGAHLLVANEGQPAIQRGYRRDPEGSVSVIELAGKRINDLGRLGVADVKTVNFAAGNLDRPEDLAELRIDPANENQRLADIEPEYIAFADGRAYVALQENNAVAVLDLATLRWSRIHDLGGVEQLIDASDKDGIAIRDKIFGLHMPDTLAAFTHQNKTYFVTANEGDPRKGVAGEDVRVAEIATDRFSPELLRRLDARYPNGFRSDDALGRLKVSALPVDADTDGDGKIDRLVMYGTRSFAIFEADTGKRVFDSGSDFARITADALPDRFNGQDNDPDAFDARSVERGSEPEGLAIADIDGRRLCAIGLERVGGVMLYDITDPNAPFFLQYINAAKQHATASTRPEGLAWIKPSQATGGKALLLVANEKSGTIDVFRVKP